jgi:hypothetical protein
MITQAQARRAIRAEWQSWVRAQNKSAPNGTDGLVFFGYLQRERSDLLAFRYSGGDKWQIVKTWLGLT